MFNSKSRLDKEPKRGFPAYVVFLCLLTAVYLAIEVPFATYLVELMGGNPSHDEVERVEHTGRIISGFAIALAYWSFQIPRALKSDKSFLGIVLACIVSAGLLVPAVYFGERALVDHIAESSTDRDRQQAARLVAAREALFHPGGMEGLDTIGQEGHNWDAFRSLFGFMNLFDNDILSRIPAGSNALESGIARTLPTEADFRTEMLPDLLASYRERYEAYKEMSDGHASGMNSLYRRAEEGWNEHLAYLKRAGPNRARQAVISRGVDVPSNWDPYDKRTFTRAAIGPRVGRVDDSYQDGINRLFGEGAVVSPGKDTLAAFMNSDQVQALIAKDLTLPRRPDFRIEESMSLGNTVRLYQLHVSGVTQDLKAAYVGDDSIFSNGGQFAGVGKESVRSIVAPVLALTLSILGAFGHMFKLLNYLVVLVLFLRQSQLGITHLLRTSGLIRLPLLGAAAAFGASTAYAPATEVTGTALYQRSVAAWTSRAGEPVGKGIEWTISVQRWITPTSTALRAAGLFNPVQAYLKDGEAIEIIPPFLPSATAQVSEPIFGTVVIDGVQSQIQLPRPRPSL